MCSREFARAVTGALRSDAFDELMAAGYRLSPTANQRSPSKLWAWAGPLEGRLH
jgi:hypothetical protein